MLYSILYIDNLALGGDGRATELINYEASLAPKTEGYNVRGFSCYHGGNFSTLKDNQKKELFQQGKKLLDVMESTILLTDADRAGAQTS
jgi:hypothetical protein